MTEKPLESVITIIGNRPQFIKMAPVSQALKRQGCTEFIIHTGQHHDDNMSQIFFDELGIPQPDLNLGVASGPHGAMTAFMLQEIETILLARKPKGVIIYGDTNSTLAAALAAAKLNIPLAHIESGPRTGDMTSPEEVNRVIADKLSAFRFCPDELSVENLYQENIRDNVTFTGDVMYDAYLHFSGVAREKSSILNHLGIENQPYALLTSHRPNNTDSQEALSRILSLLTNAPIPVVFPVHPRTEAAFRRFNMWEALQELTHIKAIPAVGYLDSLQLTNHAEVILTDSGGLQKEGFFAGKPVIILFFNTPWPQIESAGWQQLAWKQEGVDVEKALFLMENYPIPETKPDLFGNGQAADKIATILKQAHWFEPALMASH